MRLLVLFSIAMPVVAWLSRRGVFAARVALLIAAVLDAQTAWLRMRARDGLVPGTQ